MQSPTHRAAICRGTHCSMRGPISAHVWTSADRSAGLQRLAPNRGVPPGHAGNKAHALQASPDRKRAARPLSTDPLPLAGPDDATSSGRGVESAWLARKLVPGLGASGFCCVFLGLGASSGAGRAGVALDSCWPRAPPGLVPVGPQAPPR